MNTNEIGYWNKKKEKLKQEFPIIRDEDLCFNEGKEQEMLEILSYKLGKTKEELVAILVTLDQLAFAYLRVKADHFNEIDMILQIRNMESERCISMVKDELNKQGLRYKTVELGEVELINSISSDKLQSIDIALKNIGLEIIEDRKNKLIEKIKTAVYEFIHISDELHKTKISDYIKEKVNFDYTFVSKFFTTHQGITIQKYVIKTKIECVKDLLLNSDLSLSDIAFKLQYSSVAHLSNQFKKLTGYTPSLWRTLCNTIRNKKLECVNNVT